MWATRSVVQAGVELVDNPAFGVIHKSMPAAYPRPGFTPKSDQCSDSPITPYLSQNSPYHVSLGLCPYIPSFCFRDKSGDSLKLACCLSGLMEEFSLSPLYWHG